MPTPPGAIFTPQNPIMIADFPIDPSHCMGYEPCLFLECSKCGLTSKDPKELAKWCTEDLT